MSEIKVKWDDLSPLLKVSVLLSFGVGGYYLLSVALAVLSIVIWS